MGGGANRDYGLFHPSHNIYALLFFKGLINVFLFVNTIRRKSSTNNLLLLFSPPDRGFRNAGDGDGGGE